MAEVLSQSEIDALLAAVSTGEVETEAPKAAPSDEKPDYIAYDLTSQEKVTHGKFSALSGIHERFAQSFRNTLTRLLKRNVSVTVASTEFLHFGDYSATITVPTALNIILMKNLKANLIFQVGAKFAYAMVDAYYGGAERPYSKIGGREEFTSIELMMIKKLTMMAISDLQESWRPNYPVELEYRRTEGNPNFLGVLNPQDNVAVVTIDIDFDNLTGSVAIIVPIRPLDRIAQALAVNVSSYGDEEYEIWQRHWFEELKTTELDVRVELGDASRTLNDLQILKKGDVLILNQEASGELEVKVEGQAKLAGLMGTCHGNSAIRITNLLPVMGGE
ncbi:MAG: flagellar motor switch protein FliM [Deltaproteobacteria bacterium]|nr:flagellar motor switch protein FliM [Deltaproteobacteria bacterium]MBI3295019.1 flagellar motor switch protein FliM [Deltaproteobacteria bacterium]